MNSRIDRAFNRPMNITLITFITLLVLGMPRPALAGPNQCVQCPSTLPGAPNSGQFDYVGRFAQVVVQDKAMLPKLGRSICISFGSSETTKEIKDHFTRFIKRFTEIKNPTNKNIIHFINQYRNYITCEDFVSGSRRDFIQASFRNKSAFRKIFNELFFNALRQHDPKDPNKRYALNFNAVTFTGPNNGNPETVLDYIKRVLDDAKAKGESEQFISSVQSVYDDLARDYGAIHFSEFPTEVQRQFNAMRLAR